MNKSSRQPLGLSYRATLRQLDGRWKIGPIVMLRDFFPPPPFLAPYFQIFASWRRGWGGRGAHYSTLRSVREKLIPFSGIVAWKDCLRFDKYANSQIQMHLKEQPLNCSQSEIFHLDWGRRRFSFCVESDNAEIKKVLIFSVRPSGRCFMLPFPRRVTGKSALVAQRRWRERNQKSSMAHLRIQLHFFK